MTNLEAQAKPLTSPNCAGSSRKWNLATKNCCCTWPKKSQETSPNRSTGALKSLLPVPGIVILVSFQTASQLTQVATNIRPNVEQPSSHSNSLTNHICRVA